MKLASQEAAAQTCSAASSCAMVVGLEKEPALWVSLQGQDCLHGDGVRIFGVCGSGPAGKADCGRKRPLRRPTLQR
jgi:hypothetical protein